MNQNAFMEKKFAILPLVTVALYAGATEAADSAAMLEEIVVTGSNRAVDAKLMPYTVTVVTEKELANGGETQLLSTISGQVPSLFVTQRGILGFTVGSNGGAGHIKLRGIGGDRASAVLMMLDGQPQFAGIYSHHVADTYSKEYVERVEVLRGPASVLYGSNAMAGTINVITKQARKDGVHATLTSQYGSYNTWQTSLTGTARYGRLSALASLSYDRTDGNIDGLDFKQGGGYAKVGYDFSAEWRAYADYTLSNFKAHDPVYPTLSNPESTDVYSQSVTRGETSLAVSNSYSKTDGTVRAYYSYGNHYIDDPRHFHSLDDRSGIMAYQNFTPWHGSAITAGFDFNTYSGEIPVSGGNNHTEGSISTLPRKTITEYSPYVTYSQSLVKGLLTLNGGLRMANSSMFDTRWIPQAGFAVNLPEGITLKASAAAGYRNPSFRELYLYRMANPELEPERMWNYEASAGYRFSSLMAVELTAYYSKGDNLIQTVDMKNVNTGRFINKGIELSARSNPLDGLSVMASYSYLHTSLSDLTGAPRHQYYIGGDWKALNWLGVHADVKGVANLFVAPGIKEQSYALLNFKFDFEVWRHLTLFAKLENVCDARYTINRGYEMPGFTAMGGFKASF